MSKSWQRTTQCRTGRSGNPRWNRKRASSGRNSSSSSHRIIVTGTRGQRIKPDRRIADVAISAPNLMPRSMKPNLSLLYFSWMRSSGRTWVPVKKRWPPFTSIGLISRSWRGYPLHWSCTTAMRGGKNPCTCRETGRKGVFARDRPVARSTRRNLYRRHLLNMFRLRASYVAFAPAQTSFVLKTGSVSHAFASPQTVFKGTSSIRLSCFLIDTLSCAVSIRSILRLRLTAAYEHLRKKTGSPGGERDPGIMEKLRLMFQ